MLTEKSLLTQGTNYSHRNVLIVGGGPAGLAAGLMLAKRGWTNITVLEKRLTADYYKPDSHLIIKLMVAVKNLLPYLFSRPAFFLIQKHQRKRRGIPLLVSL